MINLKQISVVAFLWFVIASSALLAQGGIDTVCIGESNVKYVLKSDPSFTTESVWVIENEDIGEVTHVQYDDTILVNWNITTPGFYKITAYEYNVFTFSDNGIDTIKKSCQGNIIIDSVLISYSKVDIGPDREICFGQTQDFTSNNNYAEYLWSNNSTSQTTNEYRDGYVWLHAKDTLGCNWRDTVYLTVHPLPVLDLGGDRSMCDEVAIEYDFSSQGVIFDWYGNGNLISTEPRLTATEDLLFTYNFSQLVLNAETQYGCKSTDTVNLAPCFQMLGEIPTVITPNNDGKNDVWKIARLESFPEQYREMTVEIFDRWGKLVWNSKPGYVSAPWDGKDYRGRTLPMDSYFYVIKLNNGGNPITGHVTIIR